MPNSGDRMLMTILSKFFVNIMRCECLVANQSRLKFEKCQEITASNEKRCRGWNKLSVDPKTSPIV